MAPLIYLCFCGDCGTSHLESAEVIQTTRKPTRMWAFDMAFDTAVKTLFGMPAYQNAWVQEPAPLLLNKFLMCPPGRQWVMPPVGSLPPAEEI